MRIFIWRLLSVYLNKAGLWLCQKAYACHHNSIEDRVETYDDGPDTCNHYEWEDITVEIPFETNHELMSRLSMKGQTNA